MTPRTSTPACTSEQNVRYLRRCAALDAAGAGPEPGVVAMGGGAALARNRADIVLLQARLAPSPDDLALPARAPDDHIRRRGLWWSLPGVKLAVPGPCSGLCSFPGWPGIGMSASSLFVVLGMPAAGARRWLVVECVLPVDRAGLRDRHVIFWWSVRGSQFGDPRGLATASSATTFTRRRETCGKVTRSRRASRPCQGVASWFDG